MGSKITSHAETEARVIYTVKVTSWVVIAVSVIWCILSAVTHQWVIGAIAGMVLFSTSVSLLLVLRGHDLIGRLIWYLGGIVAVTVGVFVVHPEGHVQTMYVALLGGPFLTFSLHRERTYIVSLLGGVFAVWVATQLIGHDFFGPPILGAEFARDKIAFFALFTTFLVVTFEMGVFAYLMNKYNERLRASRRAADVANRAKSEFLAAMSHEIRTPMNGVVSMVEILENTDLTSDQRRILQTVQDSSYSLLRIIEDILDMSKIEAGKLELVNEPTDLLRTVEAAVETLRSYADTHNVYLSLSYDMSLPATVTCDAGRLRQVILNLLGNAIKFSRRPEDDAPGHVRLTVLKDENGLLRLIFDDDGIGISEDFQRQLFEPFQQSEEVTSRRYGGSGLGLAIVHQLVTKMNGIVTVKSALGEGSQFTVCLPIVAPTGKIETPHCEDSTFVIYCAGQWQSPVWNAYVGALGGVMVTVDTAEDLWARARALKTRSLFIIDMHGADAETRDDLTEAFCKDFPGHCVLSLVRDRSAKLGELANGAVAVQAAPMLPSDLFAALRLLHKKSDAVDISAHAHAEMPRKGPRGNATRILVAEDNEINQLVISRQIEQLGFEATIVADGQAAVQEWMSGDYDIILTDCHMPEMDGFALTRHIREIEASRPTRQIPIVAITANALNGEAERCLSIGMDGYLSKPVRLAELKSTIETLVAQSDAA